MITQSSTLVQKIGRLAKQRADEFPCWSFLVLEGPEASITNEYSLPYEIVEALQACLESPPEILHDAAKTLLKPLARFEPTNDQVTALLRFLADPQGLEISNLWRMEMNFRRDGTVASDLGMIDIIYTDGSWRVRYDSRQADLAEAIRTAAVIAATLPQLS